jgi:hypothetical protein
VDNFRYELAAAGAAELLLDFALDLAEESELDELDVLELLDESEDDDEDEEPLDSPVLADPLDGLLLAAAFDASRLSLR